MSLVNHAYASCRAAQLFDAGDEIRSASHYSLRSITTMKSPWRSTSTTLWPRLALPERGRADRRRGFLRVSNRHANGEWRAAANLGSSSGWISAAVILGWRPSSMRNAAFPHGHFSFTSPPIFCRPGKTIMSIDPTYLRAWLGIVIAALRLSTPHVADDAAVTMVSSLRVDFVMPDFFDAQRLQVGELSLYFCRGCAADEEPRISFPR